jgi:hypothetical protein
VAAAADVGALVVGVAQPAGQVQRIGRVVGGLAEEGRRLHGFLGLDERTLPADGALLGAVHDRDVEADAVVFGRVVRTENPVDVALAGRLQRHFVAVVRVLGPVGAVLLVAGAGGEAGRHLDAAILVEGARAGEARPARHVRQVHAVADGVVDAAAHGVGIALEIRRGVDQGRPQLFAGARHLHQVHVGRAAIEELLVRHVPAQVFRRLQQQADTQRTLVLGVVLRPALHEQVVVDRLEVGQVAAAGQEGGLLLGHRVARGRLVVDVAVVLLLGERKTDRCGVAQRHVERTAHADAVVAAQAHLDVAELLLEHRLGGLHVDRTDGRVAAPQGSLRSAQDLDRVHVEQQRGSTFGARRVDPIDEGRDFRIGIFGLRAVVADAAQRHRDDAVVALGRGLESRHQVNHVGDGLDVGVRECCRAERSDGHRRALQRRRALGRGDDHFRKRSGGARGLRRSLRGLCLCMRRSRPGDER